MGERSPLVGFEGQASKHPNEFLRPKFAEAKRRALNANHRGDTRHSRQQPPRRGQRKMSSKLHSMSNHADFDETGHPSRLDARRPLPANQQPGHSPPVDATREMRMPAKRELSMRQLRHLRPPHGGMSARELKRPGVTMMILWEEYREINQDAYGYSRFCDLLRGFERRRALRCTELRAGGEFQHHLRDGTRTRGTGAGLRSPTVASSFGNSGRATPRLEQLHRQPGFPGDRWAPPGRVSSRRARASAGTIGLLPTSLDLRASRWRAHRLGLLTKKSRSTVNSPILL